MENPTLSIIVTLGFINQANLAEGPRKGWDEFDHMAPLAEAEEDVELIIVDRAWPARVDRVEDALPDLIDRRMVAYIPPKPSRLVEHGYRACCAMRNSGAMASVGKLLAFVDDHFLLSGAVADEVVRLFRDFGRILCPVATPDIDARTPEGPPSDFGGHNAGIYMCTREQFIELNGYDEHFDGAYGEEDTEFQDRLDRLIWLRQSGFRQRRRGLLWPISTHANGVFPQRRQPFWSMDRTEYLRCNKAFAHAVCYPRIESNQVRANMPLSLLEERALMEHKCADTCSICHAADRKEQVNSYNGILLPAVNIGGAVKRRESAVRGTIDPWADQR